MSFLYITNPKATLHIKDHQVVMVEDNCTTHLPLEVLEGIVTIGNTNFSGACFKELLKRGIPTTFLAANGQYFGRLESTQHHNILRQRLQFRCGAEPIFALSLSQKFVEAKTHNQLVILRRRYRYHKAGELEKSITHIQALSAKISQVSSIAQLMGYEGSVAKAYFSGLSHTLPERFRFKGRNKQPPRDPFNSMLSFGYTLLMYECYNAIVNKGLHPYAGFLHADRNNHPSLASDLMEEWRPVLVDAMVLQLCDKSTFQKDDFIQAENGGVYLTRDASKVFIRAFTERLMTKQKYFDDLSQTSFKNSLVHQLDKLVKAIETNDPNLYTALKIR